MKNPKQHPLRRWRTDPARRELHAARFTGRLSLKTISELTNIPIGTLSKVENGVSCPTFAAMRAIAKVTGGAVGPASLLNFYGQENVFALAPGEG